MVEDEEDPAHGCWASFGENYHSTDPHDDVAHEGPRLARLVTARRGGGAKIGGGGEEEEEMEPGPLMPCNYRQWEELLLIWAIPMTWFYLIFFAG